jgi:hypothetical protein
VEYEYWIFKPNSREEVGVVIPTTEVIPHMEVGRSLFLHYRDGNTTRNFDLAIESIGLFLIVDDEDGSPCRQKMEVHIYTQAWKEQVQN